jgi:hypothetical protein
MLDPVTSTSSGTVSLAAVAALVEKERLLITIVYGIMGYFADSIQNRAV